jgi:peptidoglycan/LPS O-acetylase OafA/YrhL
LHYPLGYRPALDGLRACAVLPVLLFHGGAPGFGWGWVGVDLFFVLSGYLITRILLQEQAATGRIDLLGFYRRRALRLLPALALLCAAFLVYAAVIGVAWHGAREVLVVTFYVGNWTRAFGLGLPQYLGHTWSLAIEEQFYMLWPLLMIALAAGARVPSALRVVAIMIVAVAGWRILLHLWGAHPDRLYNGSDTRADALLVGAALALVLALPARAARLAALARYAWLPAVVVIVALPALLPWDHRLMLLGGYSMLALAAAIILTAALDDGPSARRLGDPRLVWIGQRSYGLYLWHYPIMLAARTQFQVPEGVTLTLIEVAGAFLCATLSYRFIERPLLARRYASNA